MLRKPEWPTSTSDDGGHVSAAQGSDSFVTRREEGRALHAEAQGRGAALKYTAGAIDHGVDFGHHPAAIELVRSITS